MSNIRLRAERTQVLDQLISEHLRDKVVLQNLCSARQALHAGDACLWIEVLAELPPQLAARLEVRD